MEPTKSPNTPAVSPKVLFSAIAAGAVILMVIAGLVISQLTKKPAATPPPTPTPTPIEQAKAPSLMVFQNFEVLFDEGLSKDQLDGLKFAINKYAKTNQKSAETVYIDTNTIRSVLHDTKAGRPHDSTNFNISFSNKATLTAKVEYYDLTAIHLYLTDAKSKVVFDSGPVDIYNGLGTN